MEQYYTVKETAEILKTTRQKVTRLIENGFLPAKDIGLGKERCVYRIRKSDLEKLEVN